MLSKIQERIGVQGLRQILIDSLAEKQLEELAERFGQEDAPRRPVGSKAAALADRALESPEVGESIAAVLNESNRSLMQEIEQAGEERLLEAYCPQSAEAETLPGRLLWALFSLEARPACRRLLEAWCDYLESCARSSGGGETPQPHPLDECRVAQSERQVIDRLVQGEKAKPAGEGLAPVLSVEPVSALEPKAAVLSMEGGDRAIESQDAVDLRNQIERLEEQMAALSAEFESLRETGGAESRLARLEALVATLEQRLKAPEEKEGEAESGEQETGAIPPKVVPPVQVAEEREGENTEEVREHPPEDSEPAIAPDAGGEEGEAGEDGCLPAEATALSAETESVPVDLPDEETESEERIHSGSSPGAVLQNETLIIIGGMDSLEDQYRALVEGLGGSFERFSSANEFSTGWLEDLMDRAHAVIVLGEAATQPGTFRLMEISRRLGRRLFVHHSAAPRSFQRFLTLLLETARI